MLTEFNLRTVLRNNHGETRKAIAAMMRSVCIYTPKRFNPTARARLRSAISIIRQLRDLEKQHQISSKDA